MDDDLDQSGTDSGASNQPATLTKADIEAIVTAALHSQSETTDKRFRGFQALVDKKFGEFSAGIDALKTGLSPDGLEQYDEDSAKRQIEALQQQVQMLSQRKEHPDAVDFFQEVMAADTFEDQIALIEARLASQQQAQPEPSAEPTGTQTSPVPAVDANNPARGKKMGIESAAAQAQTGDMTDEVADAILAAAPQRGALSTLRKALGG